MYIRSMYVQLHINRCIKKPITQCILTALLLVISGTQFLFSNDSHEYKVKASFIEKFTKFITWPTEAKIQNNKYFTIGIFGSTPVETYMLKIAENRTIKNKTVKILRIDTISEVDKCNLLYIAENNSYLINSVVGFACAKPVLIISSCRNCGNKGAHINFYRYGDFIRFEINITSVENSGFTFSSKLLQLAKIIK